MRKICFSFIVVAILLIVSVSFAQVPRDGTSSEGKTTFTNVAVRGLNEDGTNAVTGSPGYIEMTSTQGEVFYLYIGHNGKLMIASDETVGYNASPATVFADASGVIVGTQAI